MNSLLMLDQYQLKWMLQMEGISADTDPMAVFSKKDKMHTMVDKTIKLWHTLVYFFSQLATNLLFRAGGIPTSVMLEFSVHRVHLTS